MGDAQISLSAAKKLKKKQLRCQKIMEKETNIACCDVVTKNIAICNAGLSNGLSEEIVLEAFIKYGPLDNIIMLPGKSSCFVAYKQIEHSELAYNSINGKLNIGQDNKPVFLGYTNDIPSLKSDESKQNPEGLIIINDFITEEEEADLLALNKFDCEDSNALKHRQVKHYGYEFRYDINNVDKDKPLPIDIPQSCNIFWDRLLNKGIEFKPDQLTVNYYKPGQGIPPHVDTHSAFEDPLVSLSLESDIVMDFRHSDGRHCPILLPKRSLLIMSGESRYDWTHGITPRKLDIIPTKNGLTVNRRGARTSFTFRKVRRGECNCKYVNQCDSYAKTKMKIGDEFAAKLESMHVHDVYEKIFDHFSDTRHKPWPNVLEFVTSFQVGSVVLDVGCGNGKYLGHNSGIFDIGCDTSFGLINVCKERGFEVFNCNCLNIPLKDCVANGIISIAVIHHLATEERRKTAIMEMVRLLQISGLALIYVWAKDQNKENKSSYLMQDRKNRKQESSISNESETKTLNINEEISLPIHANRKQFEHQDLLVPWKLKKDNKTEDEFLRYYHVFEEGELEMICRKIENVEIIKSYYDQGNWCVILKKITV